MSNYIIKEKSPGAITIRLQAYSRHAAAELSGHDLEKHAALIVAAPAMLAMLKRVHPHILALTATDIDPSSERLCTALEKLIAKAGGG